MGSLEHKLAEILGDAGWLAQELTDRYCRDWLNRYGVPARGVARPASTEQVSKVIQACHESNVPVVAQGGNTSLCGGAVSDTASAVILSLERMTSIGDIDVTAGTVEVAAGVILESLHEALSSTGFMFPMHLGAEGSAQIGGLISTNAGGSHAFRYGMMQDLVLGLEVVLADGQIWDGMRAVQKDNAGYQLRKLFCGAEGTLGIVTRAVLRLFPAPRKSATALLAVNGLSELLALGALVRAEASEFANGLEFFSDFGLTLALQHVNGLNFPLSERAPWYLLIEVSTSSKMVALEAILESILTDSMQKEMVIDGTIAMSEAQRSALWRLREEQPEGQRLEGAQLKHDISVPPARLAEFIDEAETLCDAILPGVRVNAFGHLGDGNVHFNLSAPVSKPGLAEYAEQFSLEIGRLATEKGGSFAAEHGLGRSKIYLADALRSEVERDLMLKIKQSLDSKNLFNPNVLIRL